MNKKILKNIILVLIVILVVLIIIYGRKIIILKNFFEERNNMFELTNYYISVNSSNGLESEIYYKDGNYKEIEKDNSKNTEQIFYFVNDKSLIINIDNANKKATMYNSSKNPNIQLFPQNYYIIYDNFDFKTLLDYAFKLKISAEEYQGKKVYCIQNDEIKTIIDKENYITLEETYDEITKTYNFEIDSVTDEDLAEIDLQKYDVEDNNTSKEISEEAEGYYTGETISEPVSNSNAPAGTSVFKTFNITKDQNELSLEGWNENRTEKIENQLFYKKITDYAEYKKLMDNYSNLRPLIEKDFENYFAVIILSKNTDKSLNYKYQEYQENEKVLNINIEYKESENQDLQYSGLVVIMPKNAIKLALNPVVQD